MKEVRIVKITDTDYQFTENGLPYVYPRVTSIIKEFGINDLSKVPPDDLEKGRQLGSAVHSMIELYNKGILKSDSLDVKLPPYLEGYKKFRAEVSWAKEFESTPHEQEVKLIVETEDPENDPTGIFIYSHRWGFAGTLDDVFKPQIITDYKSGVLGKEGMKAAALQTAAYSIGYKELYRKSIKKRFTVHLKPGGYKIHEYNQEKDMYDFLALMTVHHLKRK